MGKQDKKPVATEAKAPNGNVKGNDDLARKNYSSQYDNVNSDAAAKTQANDKKADFERMNKDQSFDQNKDSGAGKKDFSSKRMSDKKSEGSTKDFRRN
jgi:hypothetical protein